MYNASFCPRYIIDITSRCFPDYTEVSILSVHWCFLRDMGEKSFLLKFFDLAIILIFFYIDTRNRRGTLPLLPHHGAQPEYKSSEKFKHKSLHTYQNSQLSGRGVGWVHIIFWGPWLKCTLHSWYFI